MRARDRSRHSAAAAPARRPTRRSDVAPRSRLTRRAPSTAAVAERDEGALVADLVVVHARELVTLADGARSPRTGRRMRQLGLIADGAVACGEGEVLAVGATDDVMRRITLSEDAVMLNAAGRVVLPGFVD